jgi:hypothetical protein
LEVVVAVEIISLVLLEMEPLVDLVVVDLVQEV